MKLARLPLLVLGMASCAHSMRSPAAVREAPEELVCEDGGELLIDGACCLYGDDLVCDVDQLFAELEGGDEVQR